MNTFLPFPDFTQSVQSLHYKHLGKQRLEVAQLLDALHDLPKSEGGWAPPSTWNHPVTEMWRGFEPQLCMYGLAACEEWVRRGYKANGSIEAKIEHHLEAASSGDDVVMEFPPWYGGEFFHEMMRSVLIRKIPDHYRPHFDKAGVTTREDIEQYYPSRI